MLSEEQLVVAFRIKINIYCFAIEVFLNFPLLHLGKLRPLLANGTLTFVMNESACVTYAQPVRTLATLPP
jgi:hypothetical protein